MKQACDSSEEFEKINTIICGGKLADFNAMMETTVNLNPGKTKTK